MINLFIPTRGGLNKNLFKQLNKYENEGPLHVYLCIDSDEIDLYKSSPYTTIIVDREECTSAVCPVVPKRNAILQYAKEINLKHIFMIDDDTNLDHTGKKDGTKFGYGSTRVDVYSALKRWLDVVPEDAAMTTISKNIIAREKLYQGVVYQPMTSISSVYHFNMDNLGDTTFTDTYVEDMDLLLKLLEEDKKCYTIFKTSKSCPAMGTNVFKYGEDSPLDKANEDIYNKFKDTRIGKYLTIRQQNNGVSKNLSLNIKYKERYLCDE